MGCNLSSKAARTSAVARQSAAARQSTVGQDDSGPETISSEEEDTDDYVDNITSLCVQKININMYSATTALMVEGYTNDLITIEIRDRYDVIIEHLTQCYKKTIPFTLQICIYDVCVWTTSLLNVMADFFLRTLPAMNVMIHFASSGSKYIPFINFYRKLHPIVEHLSVNNSTILRFFMDLQRKSLMLNWTLNRNWFPLNYIEVNEVIFMNFSLLKVLCQQDIVMPQVCSAAFLKHRCETADVKLILENACSVFPSIKKLELEYEVHVTEKNEPIRNHQLFIQTRNVLDSFESILDWNQGKLNIFITSKVTYNGLVNEDLARKMSEYIGYEWSYDGEVGLDVSMANVDLMMIVQHNK
ncbi:unnamed protein product [Bursaphelenchus okinawaensis]|uniref:Uncharacterized protein n=1 Tax=Bursaphelenchus okinawaensis TaxID=465554 RepID=A0A811LTW6_9BILA|nr:unnamed protein product [Bursaphelenchus okinawaensis]CAG9127777.1 unnamed protein product [Bursaphelenchus okinawaensis]